MTATNAPVIVLKLTCTDRPGIVAAVTSVIAEHGGNILESSQFDDLATGRFFMRVRFSMAETGRFHALFRPVADRFAMSWDARREEVRSRVLIMVSKMDHCLVDLLYQWRSGIIPMEIVGVVSNHETNRGLVESHGLTFHHLPITDDNRTEQEERLLRVVEDTGTDLVVLARYMQILSDAFASRLFGRIINIHHSFLPSFKGARPYHQAYDRGVKLIGATAHYVTADLDEGPIIEQDVARVTHAHEAGELTTVGRRIESRVLVRAVGWHLAHRVLLNGSKTVVFR
ncbi:formyltetrahydrofolate deformylase [Arhodomonas aquaeolei]|uniref:formyltetrahydrofolate deformylase n=1 Tax=Arhodomonas aquaeolei TaxID=2369 RepID=UPI0021696F0A|nr:formyltetrahydrofolate deformylase [Arhodomonas aquaeolei]MCS4505979.1 formyltetrahydrofolate deformylase [Arhodomonas aquaeolei]